MLQNEFRDPAVRCLLLIISVSAGLVSAGWWLWPDLTARPVAGSLEGVLAQLGAVVAALCLTWGWAVTTLTALSVTFGHTSSSRQHPSARHWGCPAVMRRAILTLCGASLVASPLVFSGVVAQAASATADPHGDPGAGPSIVQGLPLPDRPVSSARVPGGEGEPPPAPTTYPTTSTDHDTGRVQIDHVVVRPGDSLWAIAAAGLPEDSGDVTIDRAWRQIYELNRAAIGADPDLIRPGQTLAIPTEESN